MGRCSTSTVVLASFRFEFSGHWGRRRRRPTDRPQRRAIHRGHDAKADDLGCPGLESESAMALDASRCRCSVRILSLHGGTPRGLVPKAVRESTISSCGEKNTWAKRTSSPGKSGPVAHSAQPCRATYAPQRRGWICDNRTSSTTNRPARRRRNRGRRQLGYTAERRFPRVGRRWQAVARRELGERRGITTEECAVDGAVDSAAGTVSFCSDTEDLIFRPGWCQSRRLSSRLVAMRSFL
jgi:hypothetical protein